MLSDDDDHVKNELRRLEEERETSRDGGFDIGKPMEIAKANGIDWNYFPPLASMEASRWYQTLSVQQKRSLDFSMAVDKRPHFFRDARCSFGRTRVSNRDEDGQAIAGTFLPNQMLFVFDEKDKRREPRIVLGRENLALQGFPIDIIDKMKGSFTETLITDLAGNMVSTTVFLAILMSAMASLSWIPPEANTATDGRADDDDDGIDGQPMTDADFWEVEVPHEGDKPADMTDCGLEDGLLHGGPTGPAVDGTKRD